jgi:lipid A disaccharide synthetase
LDWREEREKWRARSNNVDNQWVGKPMVQTLPQKRGKGITAKKEKIKKDQKSVLSLPL